MEKGEWINLQSHPLFRNAQFQFFPPDSASIVHGTSRVPLNLMAWDGGTGLFLWNSTQHSLHIVDIRCSDPDAGTIQANTEFKTMRPNMKVKFQVRYMAIGRTGHSVALVGDGSIMVLYLNDRLSSPAAVGLCRATAVGARRIYSLEDGKILQILQVSWHPCSDTHLGILSSDSIFRMFDLSADVEVPEQEYHLQPATFQSLNNALTIRPVAFAFGEEHLWDRFTVFVLFTDSSVYALCPVVPFGSIYNRAAIEEIYKDAQMSGSFSNSVSSKAKNNASLAVAWLEAVFPELVDFSSNLASHKGRLLCLKARAYASFDASISLQGPLPKMSHDKANSGDEGTKDYGGRAVSFLYNSIVKDSILAIGMSDGQMQLYALADELEPLWNVGSSPRLRVDDDGNLLSVAMIAETKLRHSSDSISDVAGGCESSKYVTNNVWMGHAPPLLQLAVVDFALPMRVLEAAPLSLLVDPITPERFYCYHGGGIDAILLHWLPFSNQAVGTKPVVKAPSVFPVLDTCPAKDMVPSPLVGVTTLLDSFGRAWLLALTSACECAVIEMKMHGAPHPLQIEGSKDIDQSLESSEKGSMEIMSRELLLGPKDIPIPQVSSSGRSLTADSIEGRSILHDHCKLLHEKYVEYAHKVFVELKYHGVRLNKAVDDQQLRLQEAQEKLCNVQKDEGSLRKRIMGAIEVNRQLGERLKKFSNSPGMKEKPITAAERDFESQLDMINRQDLGVLRSAIEVLNARFERYMRVSQAHLKSSPSQTARQRKLAMPETQTSRLKTAVGKLSQIVDDTTRKVKVVEEVVSRRESLDNQ